jgi:phage terminase large subunit GpA-like protein
VGRAGDLDAAEALGDPAAVLVGGDREGLAEAWAAGHEVTLTPPKPGVVAWAESNLKLSERITNKPGSYLTQRTPYVREVLECFADERVRRLTLVWGAQTSKTTAIIVGMAYKLDVAPAPCLWVMPSTHLARSFSETRWMPLIDQNPTLARHKQADPDKYRLLEQHFDRMSVWFTGSNSPASLSSRSIAALCMDELDKFPAKGGKESAPLQLAEARVATYPQHIIVTTSTPTYEDAAIWTEWLKGDQRKYFVPCLACGEAWALEWEHIRWDETAKQDEGWDMTKVAETARCVCPACGHAHAEADKPVMLERGEWRATELAAEPGRRSYHLSSLYAPWRKWADLAVKFLQDRDAPGGLQDFHNRELALPWKPDGALITTQMIRDRVDASPRYTIGAAPEGKIIGRLMSIDVGQTEMWWIVRELHEDGSSYLLDYGAMIGWDGITDKFKHYKCYRGIVDAGYAAKTPAGVYDFVAKSGGLFVAAKGRTVSQGLREPYKFQQIVSGGAVLWAVQFDAHFWQARLYHDILRDGRGRWHLPRDIAKDYVSQLQGEALIEKDGEAKWQRLGPNHLADTEKMCLVLIDSIMAQYRATNETT